MNIRYKILLIALLAMFIFGCEDEGGSAKVQIVNLSDFPAVVSFYHLGYTPVSFNVNANSTANIIIEDGEAGLNVDGGRAIVEYWFHYQGEEIPEVNETYLDLSTSNTAQLQIDNTWGCLFVSNYSTNLEGDMWVTVDWGIEQYIEPWGDLINFYDPWPAASITKTILYGGFTLFSGNYIVTIIQDVITVLPLHPDACGIWVKNLSSYDNIEGVYISPSDEPTWGDNDLDGILHPNEMAAWVCEANMFWDIKVSDPLYDYTFYDIYLAIDEIYTIEYSDDRQNNDANADASKIANSAKHSSQNPSPRSEIIPRELLNGIR